MKWHSARSLDLDGQLFTDGCSHANHPPVGAVLLVGPWPYASCTGWSDGMCTFATGKTVPTKRSHRGRRHWKQLPEAVRRKHGLTIRKTALRQDLTRIHRAPWTGISVAVKANRTAARSGLDP
jgi:hypothetical protein